VLPFWDGTEPFNLLGPVLVLVGLARAGVPGLQGGLTAFRLTLQVAEGAVITDLEIRGGIDVAGPGSRRTDIQGHAPAVDATTLTEG
jgi:hypothetical protein